MLPTKKTAKANQASGPVTNSYMGNSYESSKLDAKDSKYISMNSTPNGAGRKAFF